MRNSTPPDLRITPRDMRFGRSSRDRRWWHGENPYATALYNSLSATFPKGEAFFIDSVRRFREGADPRLASEIRAFIAQEILHSREHLSFNRRGEEAGYDFSALFRQVDARLEMIGRKPPIASLAATMALEHLTAIFAHELLCDPRHLAGVDAEAASLWRWHAVEEIEHKGVAYDTWLHATRHWGRLKRWSVKARVMLLVTRNFLADRTRGSLDLLAQDGITGPRAWWGLFWYAYVRPGMIRKILGAWLTFFGPSFHPWNQDDRALIGKAATQLPSPA